MDYTREYIKRHARALYTELPERIAKINEEIITHLLTQIDALRDAHMRIVDNVPLTLANAQEISDQALAQTEHLKRHELCTTH